MLNRSFANPTAPITAAELRSFHGSYPVINSYKITPNEYTSAFSLDGSLRSTSGAVHSAVPKFWRLDRYVLYFRRESPKSHTHTLQSRSTSRLGDFKSRWTMGGMRVWRYCMPLATSRAILTRILRSSCSTRLGVERWRSLKREPRGRN